MARIRSYLHYAAEQGWCQPGVCEAVVLPRIYKEENLPSFMSWNMVQAILQRMKNAKGKSARRNYTIVLLLATYGLRCSEVANLKISDINWRKEQIHIQHAKGGKAKRSPFYTLLVKQSLNIFGVKDEMIHTMIVCFSVPRLLFVLLRVKQFMILCVENCKMYQSSIKVHIHCAIVMLLS